MKHVLRLIFSCWLILFLVEPVLAQGVWEELAQKLALDGVMGEAYSTLLASLPPNPTQSPMGRKIVELYKRKFFPKQVVKREFYPGVVTNENAAECLRYLRANQQWFDNADAKYGVPPSIACALLFVETRLGRVLADVPENAFYTLASMAVSRKIDQIKLWLPKMRDYKKHIAWIEQEMTNRADWAYKEFKALIVYMVANGLTPSQVPGSIYGAVGLCQFMPSNISVYAEDGNGDGRIDLFMIEDATMSLAKYLARHGWKPGISREMQHKLLMRYNHAAVYANTILALSDLILEQSVQQSKPKKETR